MIFSNRQEETHSPGVGGNLPTSVEASLNFIETNDKRQLENLIKRDKESIKYLENCFVPSTEMEYYYGTNTVMSYLIRRIEPNVAEYEKRLNAILEEEEKERIRLEEEKKKQEEEKIKNYPTQAVCYEEGTACAEYIWNYLSHAGYSPAVCAGILGNIMAEVGGNTLNIQWWLYGYCYYGICQWNNAYSQVWGADLKTQCEFLVNTIAYELNTFGYAHASGFNYNSFCQITDPGEAARAFARCYERCDSGSHGMRANNAWTAYNYFVG